MAKTRKTRKPSLKPNDFLEPIDITQFGSKDDPCFGKLYNLAEDECKRCGDSSLCAIVFSQNQNIHREKIETQNRFKDLEKSNNSNEALERWVKNKKEQGLKRFYIVKKGIELFGSTRDEIKSIYKKL